MLKQIKYIVAVIGLVLSIHLNAQENKSTHHHDECSYCVEGEHTNESPYKISFKNEIPYFATGLGILGTGLIVRERFGKDPFTLEELSSLNSNDINRFDRGATRNNSSAARTASDVILYGGVVLPLLFLNNHHTKKDFLPLLVMSSEVIAITGSLTLTAKFSFNRARPLAYNSEFSDKLRTDETSRLSFFSGHTAQTAAFSVFIAKVINDYHPNSKKGLKFAVWSIALGLPAVTGYLRVKGGKHFNTDVITGFAVGTAVGWLVPHLHKKRKKDSKLSMNLFNRGEVNGLSLTWKL